MKKKDLVGSRLRERSDGWDDNGVEDAELFADLSVRLRDAHRRVASLVAPEDEKARVLRRLLAISDAAKHDLRRSSERLDVFLSDLDRGWRPEPRDA